MLVFDQLSEQDKKSAIAFFMMEVQMMLISKVIVFKSGGDAIEEALAPIVNRVDISPEQKMALLLDNPMIADFVNMVAEQNARDCHYAEESDNVIELRALHLMHARHEAKTATFQ